MAGSVPAGLLNGSDLISQMEDFLGVDTESSFTGQVFAGLVKTWRLIRTYRPCRDTQIPSAVLCRSV